ncbi:Pectate lyase A precursor [Vibrio aerogenes CECT 7868]|uniref:Pectate lyase n=1 Tax=Vibrio aerogenes CECT 7868 TaxID=1216006 RepID=A0A1M5ZUF0_9VIBR|nr:pectate lyase [Vibrio aerogenes]SHI27884.1 Pectate lyase A precursor [Vibrio aerogenes CECT 7868]
MKLLKTSVQVASLIVAMSASAATFAADSAFLMLTQKEGHNFLTWSTEADSVSRQEVYRSETSSFADAKQISAVGSKRFVVEDENAEQKDYWYWVKVYKDNGETILSNASSTLPQLDALVSTSASSKCVAGATFEDETVDCGGITLGTSCDGDDEDQDPIITLKNATVKNLRIAEDGGADGIHCKEGSCTIKNVIWEDICEDAATLTKTAKSLTIVGGMAYNSKNGPGGKPDKVFQHNAKNSTTTTIKGGFTLEGVHGKLWRSCGDCTNNGGPRKVVIDDVEVDADIDSIVGVNTNYGDVAKIRNLKIKDYKSGSPKVCVEYIGVEKGDGKSEKIGEAWNSTSCNVSESDVSKL